MDGQQNIPTLYLKNGYYFRPITDDVAEKCAEIAAISFAKTNPLAQAIGKTYEEEKARILKNIKIHQQDPFTHVMYDADDEIVAVNFCSKFADCYLGDMVKSNFKIDESKYNEKQLAVMNIFAQLYKPVAHILNDGDYLFQIYAVNPLYKKKNYAVPVYNQIFHYMSTYYGGIRELSFTTNSKMQGIILKLCQGYNVSMIDHNKIEFKGKKIYDGVQNGQLALNIFGVLQTLNPEYSYLAESVPKYCEQLGLKPNYKNPPNLIQNHLALVAKIQSEQSSKKQQIKRAQIQAKQVQASL